MPLAAGTTAAAPALQVGMTVDPSNYALFAQFPGVQGSRVFWGPGSGLPSWKASRLVGLPQGCEPWLSFKDYPTDADFLAFLAAADRKAKVSWFHERDNNTPQDQKSRLDFFARQRHLRDLAVANGRGLVEFMSPPQTLQWTQVASTSTKVKGNGDWRTWWPGSGLGSVWDCYADSWAARYPDPEKFLALPFEAADGTGRPLYVAELGAARLSSDTTGAGRAAWIRDVVAILRERGAAYVAWWNDLGTGGTDFRLADKPSANAWREALTN
jgi:hypothetical protein